MSQLRKFVLTTTQGLAGLERQLQRLDYNSGAPRFNNGATVYTLSTTRGRLVTHRLRIIIPNSVDAELHDYLLGRVDQLAQHYAQATPANLPEGCNHA